MKKSLLALAALTAFAGAASAQSSATLFGIVDAGFARLSVSGGATRTGMTNSGYNSSRLGFRGVEDIGGGLKAGFHIEGQLTNDDGNAAGMNWQRRSTVSLMGGFGEIRLGRDYTPTFWNLTVYDIFGTVGIGSNLTIGMTGAAGNNVAAVRSNNSISYFTPDMGGFQLQVMQAWGENGKVMLGTKDANDYLGLRASYAAGPVSVAAAMGKTKGSTSALDQKVMNVGASFNAGMVVPMFLYTQEKTGSGLKIVALEGGANINVGAGVIRLAYSRYDTKDSGNDWNKMAGGYLHNLSKRTTVYGTFARVSNKGASARAVTSSGLSVAGIAGKSSSGMEFGVRHSF